MTEKDASLPPAPHRQLKDAPLIRVLCQVRWPNTANFDLDHVARVLAAKVGEYYPVLDRKDEVEFIFTPQGVSQKPTGAIHLLSSADDAWTVSLGGNFLALETSAYRGHQDFLQRLEVLLEALVGAAQIPQCTRLGYRYTNRVLGEGDLASLNTCFDPSVVGLVAPEGLGLVKTQSVSEAVFGTPDARLLVRSSYLPPDTTIDPTISPVSEPSWLLDIDAFDEQKVHSFATKLIVERATQLANLANTTFFALVRPDFYVRYDK